MHRLSLFVLILALVLTGPAGITAQDATPDTSGSALGALGYRTDDVVSLGKRLIDD